MKRTKKAQIKMIETIMVLVVFFFLVALGLKFYGNIQIQELQKTQTEFERLDSVKIANIVMTLPELSCTQFNEFTGSCVDYHKAIAWNQSSEAFIVGSYVTVFGDAKIELKLLYPKERIREYNLPENTITIYDNAPERIINSLVTEIPVVAYNGITRTNDFAMLRVTTYQVEVI